MGITSGYKTNMNKTMMQQRNQALKRFEDLKFKNYIFNSYIPSSQELAHLSDDTEVYFDPDQSNKVARGFIVIKK